MSRTLASSTAVSRLWLPALCVTLGACASSTATAPASGPSPRGVLDDAEYDRIREIPAYADVEFEFDRSQPARGVVVLTVGDESVRLSLIGSARGADVYAELPLSDATALALVGGGRVDCAAAAGNGYIRAVTDDVSVGYSVVTCQLEVDRNGHFAMRVDMAHEGAADTMYARGRLIGACEHVDADSTVRRVVDLDGNSRCSHIIGWL